MAMAMMGTATADWLQRRRRQQRSSGGGGRGSSLAAESSTVGRAAGQQRGQCIGNDGSTATALAEQDRQRQHSGGERVAGWRQQRSRITAVLKKAAQWQRQQSGSGGIRKREIGGGIAAANGLC
jgi:hypothetical protein